LERSFNPAGDREAVRRDLNLRKLAGMNTGCNIPVKSKSTYPKSMMPKSAKRFSDDIML